MDELQSGEGEGDLKRFRGVEKKIRAMMGVSEDDIVSGARFDRVASQF